MPRATNVYIVQNGNGRNIAAFTVKHELISWLERRGVVTDVTVLRIRDGGYDRPTITYTAKELLGWA